MTLIYLASLAALLGLSLTKSYHALPGGRDADDDGRP